MTLDYNKKRSKVSEPFNQEMNKFIKRWSAKKFIPDGI